MRRRSRNCRTSVVVANCRARIRIRIPHVGSIHVHAGSGINVNTAVYVRAINVSWPVCVRVAVAIAVRVSISVGVVVRVFGFRPLGFVLVTVRVRVSILNRLIGRYVLRRFAFLRDAADVHRDRLTCLHNLARARQLEQDGVWLCLIAGPHRAHTKLQIGCAQYFFGLEPVLADDVRHLNFRTAQREVNGGGYSEEENKSNRNHDCDTSEDGNDAAS